VVGQNVPVTGVDGIEAMLTGCVAWKNEPVTGMLALPTVTVPDMA
jgi:hypothetical protein